MVALSGDQALGPRLGGGTRAPVIADGDGSQPGLGANQVAGGDLEWVYLLLGQGRLIARLSSNS